MHRRPENNDSFMDAFSSFGFMKTDTSRCRRSMTTTKTKTATSTKTAASTVTTTTSSTIVTAGRAAQRRKRAISFEKVGACHPLSFSWFCNPLTNGSIRSLCQRKTKQLCWFRRYLSGIGIDCHCHWFYRVQESAAKKAWLPFVRGPWDRTVFDSHERRTGSYRVLSKKIVGWCLKLFLWS